MAIVIYNDNGTIKVVKLGTQVVSTGANTTESYTITWKAYDGSTLKTENLTYGETSTAPIGTADTAQYDYYWPQNSVVVTGNQTIQETRTLQSYTITWKAYNGATLKTESLTYGATSTAPTGTPEDSDWYYYWPQNSVVVTGPQTIQETRTTITSYTITWYFYNGAVAKQETHTYGATSTAPTGTTDTAQYDYSWPMSSTTVTGNETITETRTTKSYIITWKAYNGAILKSENLIYGATSTAPTGTTDTAQYDYSWPKSSTSVAGNETIQETRTTKSYTITWKAYNGAILKTDDLTYGSISYAPTGTADTDQYDYEWPKSSTSVAGNETIQETRTTKPLKKPDIISTDGAFCAPGVEIYNPNGVAVTVVAGVGVNPTTSYGELNAYGTGTFYIDVGPNPAGTNKTVYVRLYNALQGYSDSSNSSVTIARYCLIIPGL